jgi:rubrerythrin
VLIASIINAIALMMEAVSIYETSVTFYEFMLHRASSQKTEIFTSDFITQELHHISTASPHAPV